MHAKCLSATTLGIVLLLGVATPARADDAAVDRSLLDLAQSVVDAQRNFDQPALETLLAPGFLEISPIGEVDTRDEVIGFYSPEAKAKSAAGPQPVSSTLSEPEVRVHGDQAIVIAKDTVMLKMGEQTRSVAFRVLFHFRQVEGAWRLQTAQYTGLRPATPTQAPAG